MYRYIHLTIYTYEAHIVYMCLWIQIFVCMCACVCACVRRVCAQSGFGFRDFRIYYICIYVYMDIHMNEEHILYVYIWIHMFGDVACELQRGYVCEWGFGFRVLRFSKRDPFECWRDDATNLMRSLSNRMRSLTNRTRPLTNLMRNL